jgi:hypothetical protein
MRARDLARQCAVVALGAATVACSASVQRLGGGEVATPAGPARTPCERKAWLVMAPTRTEFADVGARSTRTRNDGVALYRVGSSDPESVSNLDRELGASPMLARHAALVKSYRTRSYIAAGLGVAALTAIAVGTIVFIDSFESTPEQGKHLVSSRAAVGGVLVGVGFGFGIGGLVLNPSYADRARADSANYVFLPPDDDLDALKARVTSHNQAARQRCAATPAH